MRRFFLTFSFLILALATFSNNLRIENLTIDDVNQAQQQMEISFDLLWDNSWRTSSGPSNWDAAWVFMKWHTPEMDAWRHAEWVYDTGDAVVDGHAPASGSVIEVTADQKGAYVYRDGNGFGDVAFTNMTMLWDYSTEDGFDPTAEFEVSVAGIELVYMPEGNFYLGDGSGDFGVFRDGQFTTPFLVDSEDEDITLGGTANGNLTNGYLVDDDYKDDFNESVTRTLPAAFPLGYHAMYVMKYEVTGQQYAYFLRMINLAGRENHFPEAESFSAWQMYGGVNAPEPIYPYRPITMLSWVQVAGYLDWIAFRPMSETEFEKACRGTEQPLANEYAWGTAEHYRTCNGCDFTLINEGQSNEMLSEGDYSLHYGNAVEVAVYGNNDDVVRVGIHAATIENPTRVTSGAGFYGAMDLTGNAYEFVIRLSNSEGRGFTGLHGDGEITGSGNPSVSVLSDWSFASGTGVGIKLTMPTSERPRNGEIYYNPTNPSPYLGFRGCRTAE